MASIRVPWVLPIKEGTEIFDGSKGRIPAVVRVTLGIKPDTPKERMQFLQEVAGGVLEQKRGDLMAFYQAASTAHQNGIVAISARTLNQPGIQARYQNQYGNEMIDIVIYPDLFINPKELTKDTLPWDYLRIDFTYKQAEHSGSYDLYMRGKILKPKLPDLYKFWTIDVFSDTKTTKDGITGIGRPFTDKNTYREADPIEGYSGADASLVDHFVGSSLNEFVGGPLPKKTGSFPALYMTFFDSGRRFTQDNIVHRSFALDLRKVPVAPITIDFWGWWWLWDDGAPPSVAVEYTLFKGGDLFYGRGPEKLVSPATPAVTVESVTANGVVKDGTFYTLTYLGAYTDFHEGASLNGTDTAPIGGFFSSTVGDSSPFTNDQPGALWALLPTTGGGSIGWDFIGVLGPGLPAEYELTSEATHFVGNGAAMKGKKKKDLAVEYKGQDNASTPPFDDPVGTLGQHLGELTYDPFAQAVTWKDKTGLEVLPNG